MIVNRQNLSQKLWLGQVALLIEEFFKNAQNQLLLLIVSYDKNSLSRPLILPVIMEV